jgi:hypothetical protein
MQARENTPASRGAGVGRGLAGAGGGGKVSGGLPALGLGRRVARRASGSGLLVCPGERKKEFFLSPDPSKAVPWTIIFF